MKEWWEFYGVCCGCKNRLEYGEPFHASCDPNYIDTSWQSRVNPDNVRWTPGYRFKAEKNSGYRTYSCFYGINRNGYMEFQGGVRLPKERLAEIEARYENELHSVNWYPGCDE